MIYVDMPGVTADYGKLSDVNTFVWAFPNIIAILKRYIFIKLSQICSIPYYHTKLFAMEGRNVLNGSNISIKVQLHDKNLFKL